MGEELTRMQQKVMDYLSQYMLKEGAGPTVREIAAHFGFSSAAAYCHLKTLEKKGYIELGSGKARSVKIKADGYTTRAEILTMPFYQDTEAVREDSYERSFSLSTLLLDKEKEYFAMRAQGEQMEKAGIIAGDLLVFEKSGKASDDDIVLASPSDDEPPIVRRLKQHGSRYELIPECDSCGVISCQECLIYGILRTLVRKYDAF